MRAYLLILQAVLLVVAACEGDSYNTSYSGDRSVGKCSDAEIRAGVKKDFGILNEDALTRKIEHLGGIEALRQYYSCSQEHPPGIDPSSLPSSLPNAPKIKVADLPPFDLPPTHAGDIDRLAPDPVNLTDAIDKRIADITSKPTDVKLPPLNRQLPKFYQIGTDPWNEAKDYQDKMNRWINSLKTNIKANSPNRHLSPATQQQVSALETVGERIELIQSASITEKSDGVLVQNGIASLAFGSKVGVTDFSIEIELESGWEGAEFYGSGIVGIDLSKHRNNYDKMRIEIRASQNRWAVFSSVYGNQIDSGKLWPSGYYAPLVKWGALGVTLHNAKLKHASFSNL